ncbi:MAG: O-antigen ligase family protein [Hyphomicrobiales bacterium]
MAVAEHDDRQIDIQSLAGHLLAAIPFLVLAYTFLIWPLLYGRSVEGNLIENIIASSPDASSNALLNRVYLPLVFILSLGLTFLQGKRISIPFRDPAILGLLAVLIVFAISLLWSDYAGVGLRRLVVQCFIVGSIMLACFGAPKPMRIFDILFLFAGFLVVLNLAAVVIKPAGPLGHEGIYPQKNYLGLVAVTSSLLALYKITFGRGLWRFAGGFVWLATLVLLVASQSKTSLGLAFLAPAAALGVAIFAHQMRLWSGLIVFVTIGFLLFAFFFGEAAFIWTFSSLAQTIFGDPTLTSRTEIWAFSSDMINQRPLLGFGFGSFWSTGDTGPVARLAPGFVARLNHSHNGYYDMIIQVGLVGFVLFLVFLFCLLNTAGAAVRRRFKLSWLFLTLVIYVMSSNLMETSYFYGFGSSMTLLLVALSLAAREKWEAAE